jgi:hypothetical protein
MADDLSPIYQGDRNTWTLNQVFRVGGAARSLVGITPSSIVLKLQSEQRPGTVITLNSANIAIPNGAAGIATYAPSANDVATPDLYILWASVPWNGPLQHCDPYPVEIRSAP